MILRPATAVLSVLALFLPGAIDAQVRGSERSRISQEADGTTVTIDYGRPHARGRTPVFGGLIGWGHVWTPGANWATTFEVTNDVVLNGIQVAEGRYSVWMIPGEGEWEVVLDPEDRLYHTQPPEPKEEHIRLRVTPDVVEHVEALTFDFPLVDPKGMQLRFRWGTKSIPFRVNVPSSAVLTVDPVAAAPYPGTYEVGFEGPPPEGAPPGATPPTMSVEVRLDGDRLLGEFIGGPPGMPNQFTLISVAEQIFMPAWMMGGEIFETEVDMYFEFRVEDGRATGFDVRGLEDRLMMTGQRTR